MIEKLISLSAMAPSVMNIQPWQFTVVQGAKREGILTLLRRSSLYLEDALALLDSEERKAVAAEVEENKKNVLDFFDTLGRAPAIIVMTMKKVDNDVLRRQVLVSCGAAAQNLMLAASCYDLGTCCVGSALWVEEELLEQLDLKDCNLVTIIALGHPAEIPSAPLRKVQIIDWRGV
jgi:nitroreductase